MRRRRTGPATIEEMHAAAVSAGDRSQPPRSSGWKHRVRRVRGGFFMVDKLDRRVDWGSPWAKPLGAVRMVIDVGGNRE